MGTLSVRISDEIKEELEDFAKDEKLEQPSEAARKVLAMGLEKWRQDRALKLLEEGKITFLKAAKIAQLNAWEFAELVKEKKAVWIKDNVIKEDIEKALR